MKKLVAVSLSLLLFLTACSPKEPVTTTDATEEPTTKTTVQTTVKTTTTTEEATEEPSSEQASNIDSTLVDEALIKSVYLATTHNAPKNFYAEFELKMFDTEMGDISTTMAHCKYNDDIRTESNFMGSNNISIWKENENAMYTYVEGETRGTKYNYEELPNDFDEGFGEPLMFEDADKEDFAAEGLITARIEILNNEETLYMEYEDTDSGMGQTVTKMWYSITKATPVKMISENTNGEAKLEMNLLRFEADKDFSKFTTIPSDIEFVEY